jgi:hypothetical protein
MTMNAVPEICRTETADWTRGKRSIANLLGPLNHLAQVSSNLIAKPGGRFESNWQRGV